MIWRHRMFCIAEENCAQVLLKVMMLYTRGLDGWTDGQRSAGNFVVRGVQQNEVGKSPKLLPVVTQFFWGWEKQALSR